MDASKSHNIILFIFVSFNFKTYILIILIIYENFKTRDGRSGGGKSPTFSFVFLPTLNVLWFILGTIKMNIFVEMKANIATLCFKIFSENQGSNRFRQNFQDSLINE